MKKIILLILTFSFVLGLSITSYAADNSDQYSYNGSTFVKIEHPFNGHQYAILYNTDTHYVYLTSEAPFTVVEFDGGNDFIFDIPSGTQMSSRYLYAHEFTNETIFNRNTSDYYSIKNVLWSTHDLVDKNGVKYKSGDPNFLPPLPLAEVVLTVVGEQMKVVLPEMGGTMKTLVACGVGCLALLVGLKLFGKRSLLFLHR